MQVDNVSRLRSEAGHLLVRRVLNRDDWTSDALCDVAAGTRSEWTPEDWRTLLNGLSGSQAKLSTWLDSHV